MSVRSLKSKLEEKAPLCAVVYLLIWEGLTALMWFLTARLTVNYLMFILSFTLVYPVITCWTCFRYTRICGLKLYVPAAMIAAGVAAFVLIEDARAVVPNFIVLTVLCVLFGTGIGNVVTSQHSESNKKNAKNNRQKTKR